MGGGVAQGMRVLHSGGAFFASRVTNAVLLLGQLALITSWYSARSAAAFFVLWTVGWCGAVWLRFGFDQLLPRHAAHARLGPGAAQVPGYLPLLRRTVPVLVLVLVPLLGGLLPSLSAAGLLAAVAACLLISLSWALTSVLAGLARGYGHVGLSGAVQGVVPAVGTVLAVPVASVVDRSWLLLASVSGGCLGLAAALAVWLVSVRLGRQPVRAMLSSGGRWFDRELVPAALVSALGETGLWLPVWIASGLGVAARDVAGLYAAARIASAFSWLAATVAAVATPLLADALARADQQRLTALIARSSLASGLVSAPAAVFGIVLAHPLMSALGRGYGAYAGLLVALIAGRFVDACTGPLGEALIVGGRARRELFNQVVFVVCVVGVGLALEPSHGVLGLAVATAVALAACNVPRVASVVMLLRHGWGTVPLTAPPAGALPTAAPPRSQPVDPGRARRALVLTQAGLAACAVASALLASGAIDRGSIAAFASALGLVAITLLLVLTAARRAGGSITTLARSPIAIIALLWVGLFIVRPLSLFADPSSTTEPLFELGFTLADLTLAVSIGALGCAAWSLGYLATLGLHPRPRRSEAEPSDLALAPSALMLAFGTLLWGALFMRQGGPSALIHHAASIRATEEASFYGIAGVWIVQATGLLALDRLLRIGGRNARRVLIAATLLSIAAAFALELRGLLVFAILAAGAIYLRVRPPTRRAGVVALLAGVVLVGGLAFAERVRSYTQFTGTSRAVTLALHTPPSTYAVAELTPFDNLVALGELVPRSVPRLDGSSILAIPGAFIPRALWHGKPQPLDEQVSKYLYPGVSVGSPVSVQGELWWNFGWLGVLVGALMIGAAMGAVTRWGLFARSERGKLLYAVFYACAFAPMLSALATMASNTALALVASLVVVTVLERPLPVAAVTSRARRALRRVGEALARWVQGPSRGLDGAPAPTGGTRFPLVESIRAVAALCVLVCHAAVVMYLPYASSYQTWAVPLGNLAVIAFFVTSGFVLYRPYVAARARGAPEPRPGSFVKRRLFRIVPAYWVALTLFAIFTPYAASGVGTAHTWIYYLLVSNYTAHAEQIGGLPVAWTLQIELTFYFALPALAALTRKLTPRGRGLAVGRELAAAAALLITGWALQVLATYGAPAWLPISLPATIGWFAIGMALATVTVAEERTGGAPAVFRLLGRVPGMLWLVAVAGFAGAAVVLSEPASTAGAARFSYLGVMAGVVIAGTALAIPAMLNASGGGLVRRLLSSRVLRWLGEISFGIYLYHLPIQWALTRMAILPARGPLRLLAIIAITAPLAIFCAALSWYLVERPFIRLGRRRLRFGRAPMLAEEPIRSIA